MELKTVQKMLKEENVAGWLLYDFKRSNPLACQFLEIKDHALLTRRFFYWIPVEGEPLKIVNAIEDLVLDHLPGKKVTYSTYQDLKNTLQKFLPKKRIVMEYSHEIPAVSKVDGGTIDLIRSCGAEVLSSGNLLQHFTAVLDEWQLQTHLKAAHFLDQTAKKTFEWIKGHFGTISEYDVQQLILQEFKQYGFVTADAPICAINHNSANPHYCPSKESSLKIKENDFILLDLWCKQDHPRAVYADITRVAAHKPTEKQQQIFNIVREAQKRATHFVEESFVKKTPIMGYQVDQVCRHVIEEAGFGNYFIHRTGHNIGINDHGDGAHIDNYETKDCRFLLPMTCFSIEPGIYLPNEFGIRLEYDIFIHKDLRIEVTGGIQETLRE